MKLNAPAILNIEDRKDKKICLKCNSTFLSSGNHNRLCYGCRIENVRMLLSSAYKGVMSGK